MMAHDDDLGVVGRESLTRESVDIMASWVVPNATSQFAVVLVDARTGERTVLWDRHPRLAIDPGGVPRDAVTSSRLLLVDCHETAAATEAARLAREGGAVTIIDGDEIAFPGSGGPTCLTRPLLRA